MRKVRIGNDICLNVRLRTKTLDPLNIHSVRAYIVNTSLQSNINNRLADVNEEYDTAVQNQQGRIKYISRFPIEPMSDCYHSTLYDICNSGCPTYNVRPFCWKPVYNGFGVHPHTFDGFKNHLWAYDDFRYLREKIHNVEHRNRIEQQFITYQARVELGNEAGSIRVYFPGIDQKDKGVYKVIIVAQVYVTGYSRYTKLKTITLDYGNVFEIVSSTAEGEDGLIISIGVQDTSYENSSNIETGEGMDIHVDEPTDSYQLDQNYVNLRLNDGTPIPIDLRQETEWYEEDDDLLGEG